jgi:hypothetical protein
MSTKFQEVLHTWANEQLNKRSGHKGPFIINKVRLDYEEGYAYSEYTSDDAHLDVVMDFQHPDSCCSIVSWTLYREETTTISLLNELLSFADIQHIDSSTS